jgi:hypothetical protein
MQILLNGMVNQNLFALVTSARCLNRVNEKELGNGRLLMSLLWQQLVVFQSFLSPLFIFKLTEN